VVLALSFVLEGISFLRSVRQARPAAELLGRDVIEEVMATSDPTLRAVFFEDSAALVVSSSRLSVWRGWDCPSRACRTAPSGSCR